MGKLKCNKNTCNRNGICLIKKNKIKCNCKNGYKGKYCERWYCDHNCNNNGLCKDSRICICDLFYSGNKCDMYLVNKNIDPDKDNQRCYHRNNSIKCFCSNNLMTRQYCTKILCLEINSSPHNQKQLNILDSSCDCRKLFPDIRCCIYFALI
uniref:Protein glp-1 (Trinotate prediction) n=1 Tax=Henneguya salminicola TaxID=69463 RepID=A0A6G3MIL5_HENSL